jgi:antitoxin HicB
MEKTLDYYLALPYTIELQYDPEGAWFVRVKELRGCMSQGDTPEEAVAMIKEAMELWLEVALEDGDPIPEPREHGDYSGKFVVRVPRSLHRELVEAAEAEGVSLNQYINVALARAVAMPPASAYLQGPASGNVGEFASFQPYVPSGRPAGAARDLQEDPGRYSASDEKADAPHAPGQTRDDG